MSPLALSIHFSASTVSAASAAVLGGGTIGERLRYATSVHQYLAVDHSVGMVAVLATGHSLALPQESVCGTAVSSGQKTTRCARSEVRPT